MTMRRTHDETLVRVDDNWCEIAEELEYCLGASTGMGEIE